MRMRAIAAIGAAVLLFVLMTIQPVAAQGPQQPQIQPSYTLNKQYEGNFTFIGGEFELTNDGEVDGNVSIAVTQIANLHGVINGNLTVSAPLGGVDVTGLHVNGNVSICARY